ncbi:class I SAM-dependent methyltransferase [Rickettsiales endosymbiont of Stachyamoeba lipophora]|uniref:class I SAM-dependent methyltransferase n=1 Tax=Rickettsiales endosymbiont of Stachyamoeba lipophora TaxID=2486578 RepID=UPI000F647F9B|nr:class I SAM-dependent methyltransferase [Rickettsiales endosymbiont of Stachyamoeba lipophora]AZL15832.1 class I SAM-dependent methyltransferase [Rickettsiales endosymbiont of Stachyamoeba lipophora]
MKSHKITNLLKSFYLEILYNAKNLKSRLKNILHANFELCNFYIDDGDLKDAEFRIKVLKYFKVENPMLKFCEARLKLAQGNLDAAKELLGEFVKEDKHHVLANFLYDELIEGKKHKFIPSAVVNAYAEMQSNYELNLKKKQKLKIAEWVLTTINQAGKEDGSKLTDLGCGTGSLMKIIASNSKYLLNISGVDGHKACIAVAKEAIYYNQQLSHKDRVYKELYLEDVYHYLEKHTIDVDFIVAINIVNYLREPYQFLEKIAQKMSNNARLFVVYDYTKNDKHEIDLNKFLMRLNSNLLKEQLAKFELAIIREQRFEDEKIEMLMISKVAGSFTANASAGNKAGKTEGKDSANKVLKPEVGSNADKANKIVKAGNVAGDNKVSTAKNVKAKKASDAEDARSNNKVNKVKKTNKE